MDFELSWGFNSIEVSRHYGGVSERRETVWVRCLEISIEQDGAHSTIQIPLDILKKELDRAVQP